MGITISPLRLDCWLSAGRDVADSPDAMATIVADVELGGIFSSPWTRWLLPKLSTGWLRSLLSSVVQVRPRQLAGWCCGSELGCGS